MKVDDILASKGRTVETISPDATVERAAQRLRSSHIGALVVTTEGRQIKGLVSERDIVYALARHGRTLFEMRVRDVMRQATPTCSPVDTIEHVMLEMTRSRMRHLPVVDHGELCGVVSIGDVVKNRLDETGREVTLLRDAYLGRG
jgi:CBS domain-containing protein